MSASTKNWLKHFQPAIRSLSSMTPKAPSRHSFVGL
jgi:hypothetical protein